jgi:hypothetical protein
MTPAVHDLELKIGTTFGPVLLRCKDGAGEAVDLTGWTAYADVRVKPGAAVVFGLAPAISDAAAGEITLGKTDEQTAALTPGRYKWDLILETPDGKRLGPYVAGACIVSQPITKPA